MGRPNDRSGDAADEPPVTLEEFVREVRAKLLAFEADWRRMHAADPEHYPMALPPENAGVWWESFDTFEPTVPSAVTYALGANLARQAEIEDELAELGYIMELDTGAIPGKGRSLVRDCDAAEGDLAALASEPPVHERALVLAREWSELADRASVMEMGDGDSADDAGRPSAPRG